MSDTFPTAAEKAAAKTKADAKATAETFPTKVPTPSASTAPPDAKAVAESKAAADKVKAAVDAAKALPGPFPLTTDDKFVLKDFNNDGIFDTIVVERHDRVAEAKAKAEAEHYADFYNTITTARHAAAVSNAGRPAVDITAAEDAAEAKVRVGWKGPVPPAEKAKADAKVAAAKEQAAIEAELSKMPRK